MSAPSTPDRIELERTFVQADFDAFAALSGDDNPIHVDAGFSARTRFGRPVAHGVLLHTVIRGMLGLLVPGGRQQDQALMFTAPTYAEEPMRFSVTVREREVDSMNVDIEIRRIADGEVTCRGETRICFPGAVP